MVVHQYPGQIALPQVLVKAAVGAQVQKPFDLGIDTAHQLVPVRAVLPVPEDTGQAGEDRTFPQVAI